MNHFPRICTRLKCIVCPKGKNSINNSKKKKTPNVCRKPALHSALFLPVMWPCSGHAQNGFGVCKSRGAVPKLHGGWHFQGSCLGLSHLGHPGFCRRRVHTHTGLFPLQQSLWGFPGWTRAQTRFHGGSLVRRDLEATQMTPK